MATISTISNTVFDSILPICGQPANGVPVWNEGQKMFIAEEYESAAGNRYYKGIRFCENLAIVETVGNYHTWTYIDGVEIYAFDGKERRLVGKRQYDKRFYDPCFIKTETKQMIEEFILSQTKLTGMNPDKMQVKDYAESLVERSYVSLLEDDYLPRIQQMLPIMLPQLN